MRENNHSQENKSASACISLLISGATRQDWWLNKRELIEDLHFTN